MALGGQAVARSLPMQVRLSMLCWLVHNDTGATKSCASAAELIFDVEYLGKK